MKRQKKHERALTKREIRVDEAVSRLVNLLESRGDQQMAQMLRDAHCAERASLLARGNPLSDISEAEVTEILRSRPENFERCDSEGKPDPRGKFWRLTFKHHKSDGNA
jgi:hypothetical protein